MPQTQVLAAGVSGSSTGATWDHIADPAHTKETVYVSATMVRPEMCSPSSASPTAGHKRDPEEAVDERRLRRRGPSDCDKLTRYVLLTPRQPPEGLSTLSLCRCLLKVETQYGGKPFRMVVDTGATVNLVSRDRLEVTADPVEVDPIPITTVTGAVTQLRQQVTLLLELNAYPYADFFVAENLPADAILGIDAIVEAGWIIDVFRRCLYHLTHAIPPVPLAPCPHTVVLAYAVASFELPSRSWKRIGVKAGTTMTATHDDALLLLTPSPPQQLTVHGAPTVMSPKEEQLYVLLCNYGLQPLKVEQGSPLACVEVCLMATANRAPPQQAAKAVRMKSPKLAKVREVFDFAQVQANWGSS